MFNSNTWKTCKWWYESIAYLNINGTYVTDNLSTNDNIVFFFVSDLKIVYYYNNQSSITMPWTKEENIFLTAHLETKSFFLGNKSLSYERVAAIYDQKMMRKRPAK